MGSGMVSLGRRVKVLGVVMSTTLLVDISDTMLAAAIKIEDTIR